ncbi:M56 family metallopeptidase [Agathobaculum sp. NTUH-O15-33]|uniref:M56 family metallopeptidase n=1 Tax=Agathobaculum sp. NTUH-O15-33 TaxID=3079302 RepID=UPI0029585719|nr:M56 family metallopeptidase [Agathobaculum sp. NTUH-O15-33]WNX84850.1 M56 family metallopeptidase [Agathobaculum sp. NTUH-O15-33]
MNEILKTILSLSLSGTLLILILFLCKFFVKDRLSKRWQYYIWLVIVARLLLPFTPNTSLTGALFQGFDRASVEISASSQPDPDIPQLSETAFFNNGEHTASESHPLHGMFDKAVQNIGGICLLIWLITAIGLLIRKITVYQSFVKYLKAGQTEVSDIPLWERVGKLAEQTGIKGAVGLYTNSLISSPLLIGFFRPRIILPTTELTDSDFTYTILHELTHYKRHDMFYKWLIQITICLHWFNPIVYLMGREINKACELSCDEAMIRPLDLQERRAYGDTLLNAVNSGGGYKNSIASVTLSESTALLKERLDAIMHFDKPSKATAAVTYMLSLLVLCSFSFIGAYAADFKAPADTRLQSMQSATTILTDAHDITSIEVLATVGHLNVVYGETPQIQIGAELIGHASFSYENGALLYHDDLKNKHLSLDETNEQAYKIVITVPHKFVVRDLIADVGIGTIDLKNISAGHATLNGTDTINLDGFHSDTLNLKGTLADISAMDISISKELRLSLYGSRAAVSGAILGNVLIESAGISNTNITFLHADRKDYYMKSSWQPDSQQREPGNMLLKTERVGILIDGKKYSMEYADPVAGAPNQVTVISRELMPMDNIAINFTT